MRDGGGPSLARLPFFLLPSLPCLPPPTSGVLVPHRTSPPAPPLAGMGLPVSHTSGYGVPMPGSMVVGGPLCRGLMPRSSPMGHRPQCVVPRRGRLSTSLASGSEVPILRYVVWGLLGPRARVATDWPLSVAAPLIGVCGRSHVLGLRSGWATASGRCCWTICPPPHQGRRIYNWPALGFTRLHGSVRLPLLQRTLGGGGPGESLCLLRGAVMVTSVARLFLL